VFLHPASVPPEINEESQNLLAEFHQDSWHVKDPALASLVLEGAQGSVATDLLASRMEILRHTGKAPTWLAWPYGFADGSLDSLCHVVGFHGTVSLKPATFSPETGNQVGRFALTAKSTLDRIKMVFPDNAD